MHITTYVDHEYFMIRNLKNVLLCRVFADPVTYLWLILTIKEIIMITDTFKHGAYLFHRLYCSTCVVYWNCMICDFQLLTLALYYWYFIANNAALLHLTIYLLALQASQNILQTILINYWKNHCWKMFYKRDACKKIAYRW